MPCFIVSGNIKLTPSPFDKSLDHPCWPRQHPVIFIAGRWVSASDGRVSRLPGRVTFTLSAWPNQNSCSYLARKWIHRSRIGQTESCFVVYNHLAISSLSNRHTDQIASFTLGDEWQLPEGYQRLFRWRELPNSERVMTAQLFSSQLASSSLVEYSWSWLGLCYQKRSAQARWPRRKELFPPKFVYNRWQAMQYTGRRADKHDVWIWCIFSGKTSFLKLIPYYLKSCCRRCFKIPARRRISSRNAFHDLPSVIRDELDAHNSYRLPILVVLTRSNSYWAVYF